jgi:hypothetical protein
MQSLFPLSPIRSAVPPPKRPRSQQIFAQVFPHHASRWPSFLASAALHLVLGLVVPPIAEHFAAPADRETVMRHERLLRTLRIRVPERLYIASAGSSAVARRPIVYRRPTSVAPSPQMGGATEGKASRRSRAPGRQRRFDLPPLPRRTDSDQSIVQPRFAADMLPLRDLHLPEVFFWAPPVTPQAVVKPFVLPGHTAPPTAPRLLDAPPRLELPSPELAELSSAEALQLLERAALSIPQNAMPIRTTYPEQPVPHTGVSADPVAGDPTNVLSISNSPLPLREYLTVPPGNQVGRSPASGLEAQGWAGGAGGGDRGTSANGPSAAQGASTTAAGGPGNPRPGPGGSQTAAGGPAEAHSGNARTQTAAAGTAEAPPGAAQERTAAVASAGASRTDSPALSTGSAPSPPGTSGQRTQTSSPPATGTPPSGGAAARSAAVEATRMVLPTGGVFDVVVQSSGPEGFPESAGVLSGKPIYSVYLAVGAPKEWILQYCIPAEEAESAEVVGGVVRLGAPAPLTAPYPRTTFRPPPHHRPGGYLMVHGFIGANGRFQDLRVLGAGDPRDNAHAIAVLEHWEFRPAARQGQPMHVEILLAIPAE